MRAASQRLLQTWVRWQVLAGTDAAGTYGELERQPIGPGAARIIVEARTLADPTGAVDIDDLPRSADLFPFLLPELRPLLKDVVSIHLNHEGGRRLVARPAFA